MSHREMGNLFNGLLAATLLVAAPVVAQSVRPADAAAPRPLTLSEAVALALENSPAIGEADAKVMEAVAGVDVAGADRWPQLRADARFTHLSDVPAVPTIPGQPPRELGEADTAAGMLSSSWAVYSGGRIAASLRRAVSSAEAEKAMRERVRQTVAFNAERSFLLLLGAQREVEVAVQALAAAEGHVAVAASRLEARAAARYDVIRADVEAEDFRQRLVAARSGVASAHATLLEALGLAEGSFEAVDGDARAGDPMALDELLREARLRRPELAALDRQGEAAAAALDQARGERLPAVSIGADWQEVSPDSATQYDRWSVGASVSVPVFDGGRISARKVQAAARIGQVGAAREAVLRQVEAQVRQADARFRSAAAQVPLAGKRVTQAEELVRLAEVRYREGVGTATEAADARASLTAARQGLVLADIGRALAEAEVRWATGAGAPGRGEMTEVPR